MRTIVRRRIGAVAAALAAGLPSAAYAAKPPKQVEVSELATFAAPGCDPAMGGGCGQGSTVGPDKALYVTDGPDRAARTAWAASAARVSERAPA